MVTAIAMLYKGESGLRRCPVQISCWEAVKLDPGDVVVVFSDGVSEALDADGAEFGDDRLEAVVAAAATEPSSALVERIVGGVREFTKGAPQSDDITVMVIRYLGEKS
jgi:serine phosphatase RsbU (regulator of sigma subunit)